MVSYAIETSPGISKAKRVLRTINNKRCGNMRSKGLEKSAKTKMW